MSETSGDYSTPPTTSLRFRFLAGEHERQMTVHTCDIHQAIMELLDGGEDFSAFLGVDASIGKHWCPISDSLVWQAIAQIALARLRESEASRGDRRGMDGWWTVLGDK